jgi:hypothetical protein
MQMNENMQTEEDVNHNSNSNNVVNNENQVKKGKKKNF